MKRPESSWTPSPNFKTGGKGRRISCLVLHATATSGIDSPREWLCNPESEASAHYLVGRDGKILQLVDEDNVAWHAGESRWRGTEYVNPKDGKTTVNNRSIGIEMVNSNDGKMPYPPEQVAAVLALAVPICKDYGIKIVDVVGHLDVAPGRKTDPAAFPWDDFKLQLHDAGLS